MRLLNTITYELHTFPSPDVTPHYAILSHCWDAVGEVTFADIQDLSRARAMPGWFKVEKACAVARQEHHCRWLWMDTCCIDKSSSAELSEAINSMFDWYLHSEICLAYLDDVPTCNDSDGCNEPLKASRWFTRGWTLQELIAPTRAMHFLSKDWINLGTRRDLASVLEYITKVDRSVLHGSERWHHYRHISDLRAMSVAKRMSWAAGRKTTRPEDRAYSLMGIFGVNMPILYGEGSAKAFRRLQLEIIQESFDHSIFAWGSRDRISNPPPWRLDQCTPAGDNRANEWRGCALLAKSPDDFQHSADLRGESLTTLTDTLRLSAIRELHFYPTNYGIRIVLPLYFLGERSQWQLYYALLACRADSQSSGSGAWVGLLLMRVPRTDVYHCMNISDTKVGDLDSVASRVIELYAPASRQRLLLFSDWKLSTIYIRDYVQAERSRDALVRILRPLPPGLDPQAPSKSVGRPPPPWSFA
ncbi:HET-domain-containing protein [Cubamyces sp. BRFM 1775]|nr:HET-domain-containing protein [Cubamyces sp. BRFM 1775]